MGERLTQSGVVAHPRVSDAAVMRREDGFTLVELVVVMVIIAVLVSFGLAFHFGARERSSDAVARSNLRTAVPAFESYRADNGGYGGMTTPALRSAYNPAIGNIVIAWTAPDDYCASTTVNGRTWWKAGPSGAITMSSC
jgi:prepilin-type N-terminal cleavage/methylation domain-containing protein